MARVEAKVDPVALEKVRAREFYERFDEGEREEADKILHARLVVDTNGVVVAISEDKVIVLGKVE